MYDKKLNIQTDVINVLVDGRISYIFPAFLHWSSKCCQERSLETGREGLSCSERTDSSGCWDTFVSGQVAYGVKSKSPTISSNERVVSDIRKGFKCGEG